MNSIEVAAEEEFGFPDSTVMVVSLEDEGDDEVIRLHNTLDDTFVNIPSKINLSVLIDALVEVRNGTS